MPTTMMTTTTTATTTTEPTEETDVRSEPPPTTTKPAFPEVVQKIYHDPSIRRKSDIGLLKRINKPNIRPVNILQASKKTSDDEDEEEEYSEVTHFRERLQTSNTEMRYKTSRNKTQTRKKRSTAWRSDEFGRDNATKNETVAQEHVYHIGTGLTLSCCLLVYSGM